MNTYSFKTHFIFCIILGMPGPFYSQSYFNQIKGARLNGLANQSITIRGPESWPFNPSTLGFESQWSFSITGESRFIGTGIRGSSISASLPIHSNSGIAFGGEFYGLPEYHQGSLRLGYGRLISNRFSIGSSLQYLQFFNTLIKNKPVGLITLGTLYNINDQFSLGASFHFPFYPALSKDQYRVSSFQLGCSYSISAPVKFYTELDRKDDNSWNIKVAFEYQIVHALALRLGVSTLPQLFSAGVSVQLSNSWRVDLASVFYQGIGLTPSLSLVYRIESQKNEQE